MRVSIVLAVAAAIATASCGNPAAPSNAPIPTVHLGANHVRYRTGTDTTERFTLSAQYAGVEGGDRSIVLDSVLFDGVRIPAGPAVGTGDVQTFSRWDSLASVFDHDGRTRRWTVFGAQPMGRLDADMTMLRQRLELLEPQPGDTVTASEGFWVRWTPSSDVDALVSIIGPYFSVDSIPDTGAYFVEPFEPDLTDRIEVGFAVLRGTTVVVAPSTSFLVRLRTTTADGVEAHVTR